MRLIKLGFISIIVISLVLLAISLMMPSHVRVSRAMNMAAPVEKITPYLSNLNRWKQWNLLVTDSSIKTFRVNQEHIMANRFEIFVNTIKPDSVTTRWVQPDGKQFLASFSCIPSGNLTIVQWYFDFNLRWYPWEKFGSIIYDEQMGPGMEKSLAQLKLLVESSQ